jgi:cobalt/nickel transport system permease protein
MMEENLARGDSPFHRRDPRVKLIAAAAFVSVTALCTSLLTATLAVFGAGILLGVARLKPSAVGRRLLAANAFTFFLLLTLPVTYGGEVAHYLGPVPLSGEGIRQAILIALKTNAIVLALLALLATSTIAALGNAMESLGCPRRLCFLLLFSYRYIFVIHHEYQKLQRAAELRCFVPKTNLHTYRTFAYLFGMTMVHSWNRSFRVQQAMQLRGFDGRLIPLARQTTNGQDLVFLTLLLLGVVVLVASQLLSCR